jgi:hypothetical protein
MRFTLAAAALALLALASCARDSQETAGDFTYTCARGGGLLADRVCEAALTDHIRLWLPEGGTGPIIRYETAAGDVPLVPRDGAAAVVAVGMNTRFLVARTAERMPGAEDGWYVVRLDGPALVGSGPSTVGPMSRAELEALYTPDELPEMRPTQ